MTPKNTVCLWFDRDALEAAQFYADTIPDSSVGTVMRAPGDFPDGKEGDVLTVEFAVAGIPCVGLNGGPAFQQSEAFSFQIATDDQAETDRLGMPLSITVARRAPAVGARTGGACRGRSPRERSSKGWQIPIAPQRSGCSTR